MAQIAAALECISFKSLTNVHQRMNLNQQTDPLQKAMEGSRILKLKT